MSFQDLDEEKPRRFFQFKPDVTSGTLIQILVILAGAVVAYGTYQSDKTQTRADIEAVKIASESNRKQVQDALVEIKVEMREIRDKVNQTSTNVEVLKAQGATRRP